MTPTPIRTLAVLLAAGVLLGACGGGSEPDAGKPSAGADVDGVAFAQCMRENGVDMPDPQGGAGVQKFELPEGVTEEQLRTAQKKCEDKLPKLGGPDESDPKVAAEMHDQAMKFAECMREQGLDWPDPVLENGRLVIKTSKVNPSDPAVQKATEACREHMPTPPGSE